MQISKLALAGTIALAAAVLAPRAASAGGVWTDGNWYAACPESVTSTRLTIDPPQGYWENEFVPFGAYASVPFVEARASGNLMSCYYAVGSGSDTFRFELRDIAPAPYTSCVAYNGPWFICMK